MKYNEKYGLYIDDDLVIYYWNKRLDKLMQKSISKNGSGYLHVMTKIGPRSVHRIIYETFVGPIPDGYEIDHINAIKTDNRLENLRCVTHKENCNNNITLRNISKAQKGNPDSEFGRKFKEHYGITHNQNYNLYYREYHWYRKLNNKCRWE